jgi:hypothetical protein
MAVVKDLSDLRFGRLLVLKQTPFLNDKGEHAWWCKCECGKTVSVRGYCLRRGSTSSCGCLRGDNGKVAWTTHGLTHSSVYSSWISMIRRCTNPETEKYSLYGGRGIKVCDRWLNSVEAFETDMPPRPGEGYSIDRINTNGNYEPGNCKWSTAEEQSNNRRNVKHFEYNGEMLSVAQIARKVGFSYTALYTRIIRDGMSVKEAISSITIRPCN